MRCPYCNSEMKRGYIDAGHGLLGLLWEALEERDLAKSLFGWKRKCVILLQDKKSERIPNSYTIAYLCRSCHKVIIEYVEPNALLEKTER